MTSTYSDEERRALEGDGQSNPVELVPVAWRCGACPCQSYTRVDDYDDLTGHFTPGNFVRCNSCKVVTYWPASISSAQAALSAAHARADEAERERDLAKEAGADWYYARQALSAQLAEAVKALEAARLSASPDAYRAGLEAAAKVADYADEVAALQKSPCRLAMRNTAREIAEDIRALPSPSLAGEQ